MTSVDFPYRNEIYSDTDRIKIFNEIKNESLKIYTNELPVVYDNIKISNIDFLLNGKFTYLIANPKEKYHLYMLSDLFNDHCRVLCTFGNNISPYNYYKNNKNKIINNIIKKKKEPTKKNIREEIYKDTKECSIHNPLIIKFFIDNLNAKKILDMSMGWGDRLIGTLIANTDVQLYYGTDPNICLHPGYEHMKKILLPLSSHPNMSIIIENKGFQDIKLPDNLEFDILYTSPPYFDYEIYSDDKNQSTIFAESEGEWISKFLLPSMTKIVNKIKNGGHIILYFSQEKGKTYMEKFLSWMKYVPEIYYLGNIFFTDTSLKKKHPIFIYEKNTIIPKNLYNPSLIIDTLKFHDIKLNIIRDDLIIGGTKCRATLDFVRNLLKEKKINTLIYLGASNGYAQVALSYCLLLLKSNVQMIFYAQTSNNRESDKLQKISAYLYPHTKYINLEKPFKDIWPLIDAYLSENPKSYLLPFGMDDLNFKKILYKAIKPYLIPIIDKITRLWIVIGSGVLFSVLYKILHKTHFCLVQVGKNIDFSDYDSKRITLYKSSYKLYQPIKYNVPYPTVKSYDAKIWEFRNNFLPDDYIWNVGGIHQKIT